MKPSATTLESLSDIQQVRTLGDVRRIISQSLLALARKEISAADVTAMSRGVDSISNSINAEIALAKVRQDLRQSGADLGAATHFGATLIGND